MSEGLSIQQAAVIGAGTMAWADAQGAAQLLTRLQQLQQRFGQHWRPVQLIERLAANGQVFADVREGGL